MCTVSWIHDKDGYQLLCNRDEKLTRKSAQGPRLAVRDGTRFLAPVDGDFGGTWIATNEFGVSICLLNGVSRPCSEFGAAGRSRGLLVLDLIPLPSVAAISDRLRELELSPFAPFTLAALEPGHPVAILEWDCSRKTLFHETAEHVMLTSSSFDSEEVRRNRQKQYGHVHDIEGLFDFHRCHVPARSAYSTCMHRADAETVSFSWIQVSREGTDFFYTPGAPCENLPEMRFKLARRPSSGSSQQLPARAEINFERDVEIHPLGRSPDFPQTQHRLTTAAHPVKRCPSLLVAVSPFQAKRVAVERDGALQITHREVSLEQPPNRDHLLAMIADVA